MIRNSSSLRDGHDRKKANDIHKFCLACPTKAVAISARAHKKARAIWRHKRQALGPAVAKKPPWKLPTSDRIRSLVSCDSLWRFRRQVRWTQRARWLAAVAAF